MITAPFVITRSQQIWRQSETCVLAAVNQTILNDFGEHVNWRLSNEEILGILLPS